MRRTARSLQRQTIVAADTAVVVRVRSLAPGSEEWQRGMALTSSAARKVEFRLRRTAIRELT